MAHQPRVVLPEILDGLPHDHPDAIASRRDLRRINAVMGNRRWIVSQTRKLGGIAARGITEIGAGDGRLAIQLAKAFPQIHVTALDLAPPPELALPANVEWQRMDLFSAIDSLPTDGILIACLFLHHFGDDALGTLGRRWISRFDAVVISEPDRRILAHRLGRLAWPFINRVTRHDMHVSIDAGFARGELAGALGLVTADWTVSESRTLTGARRLVAVRTG